MAQAQPRPPPLLIDDVTPEILLRLPPDEPEHLFRVALVCKRWLRILCDAAFLRRYRAFHGAPPLLGLLDRVFSIMDGKPASRFASTTALPDFRNPGSDDRHGRVLFHMLMDQTAMDLLVWDPVTGDRHRLRQPEMDIESYSAVVLCAADGCDHLDCHGGPFRIVFLSVDHTVRTIRTSVYFSKADAWSTPVSFRYGRFLAVQSKRGTVVGNEIYFMIWRGAEIVKYDLAKNCLSEIDPPPPDPEVYKCLVSLMVMEDSSLGLAGIQGSSLHIWSRKVNAEGATEWVRCRAINLEQIMPMAKPRRRTHVVGFTEGLGAVSVRTDVGLFTLELKSGRVKKVEKTDGACYSVLPYVSFYTPEIETSTQEEVEVVPDPVVQEVRSPRLEFLGTSIPPRVVRARSRSPC